MKKKRSSLLFGGNNLFHSLTRYTVAVLHCDELKNRINCTRMNKKRMNSSYSSKSSQCKIASAESKETILSPKQQRRPLPFLLSLSFFYAASFYKSRIFSSLAKCQVLSGVVISESIQQCVKADQLAGKVMLHNDVCVSSVPTYLVQECGSGIRHMRGLFMLIFIRGGRQSDRMGQQKVQVGVIFQRKIGHSTSCAKLFQDPQFQNISFKCCF